MPDGGGMSSARLRHELERHLRLHRAKAAITGYDRMAMVEDWLHWVNDTALEVAGPTLDDIVTVETPPRVTRMHSFE